MAKPYLPVRYKVRGSDEVHEAVKKAAKARCKEPGSNDATAPTHIGEGGGPAELLEIARMRSRLIGGATFNNLASSRGQGS